MKSAFFRCYTFKARRHPERGRIYLFAGLASPLIFYLPAIRKFRKAGFSVVVFTFRTRAMYSLSHIDIPKAVDELCDTVALLEKSADTSLPAIALGNSMGSAFAWHAASRVQSIDRVVANTGYAVISRHVFEDKSGSHWRKKLLRDGIDEAAYHKLINKYEPAAVFDKLRGKKVLLFMNRDDKVIGFSQAALFKQALEKNKINYEYIENHGMGHVAAIWHNLMSRKLLDFLKT